MIHFDYQRRETFAVDNIGGKHVPVVIADLSKIEKITPDICKVLDIPMMKQPINGISVMQQQIIFLQAIKYWILHYRAH